MAQVHYASVTRISSLPDRPMRHGRVARERWAAGDYVVARVRRFRGSTEGVEVASGREVEVLPDDLVVGALGRRYATLEAAGSFEAVGEDGLMSSLTAGGCFGRITSRSAFSPALLPLEYVGHVLVDGGTLNMRDVVPPPPDIVFDLPVVLIAGTSMSAGKTYAGRVVVRCLREMGRTAVAAKLTGAARRHDVLSFRDAGARHIFDFVDAGLPTTVCPPDEFRGAIGGLLARIAATEGDVLVAEAGASPLEPYNGGTLVDMIRDQVVFTVICASDPYAVVGIREAWDMPFDLVAGPAANTEAGVELVRRLTGLEALDLVDRAHDARLRSLLEAALDGSRSTP